MRLPHNAHVAIVDGENFIVMRNTGQPSNPSSKMRPNPTSTPPITAPA